jgi:hypothetical protein
MLDIGPIGIVVQTDVSGILLSSGHLRRYGDTINPGDKEDSVRKIILGKLGDVPAFKKRGFGNKPSKEEPK